MNGISNEFAFTSRSDQVPGTRAFYDLQYNKACWVLLNPALSTQMRHRWFIRIQSHTNTYCCKGFQSPCIWKLWKQTMRLKSKTTHHFLNKTNSSECVGCVYGVWVYVYVFCVGVCVCALIYINYFWRL